MPGSIPTPRTPAAPRRRSAPLLAPVEIEHFGPNDPGREPLERFVAAVFRSAYGARIRSFYPHLLALKGPDASLAAVAGVRSAGEQRLFAEHYLDARVEQHIARCNGRPIPRDYIVEVGNLAPARAGQARWLIAALAAYLHGAGYAWVVFTAVNALGNAFSRLDLRPIPLVAANPERLPAGITADWGSYYRTNPVVYAGEIARAYALLARGMMPDSDAGELWRKAQAAGARVTGRAARPPLGHAHR